MGNNNETPTIVLRSKKGYGSTISTQSNKLNYTWTGIDVFGETPPQGSYMKTITNRLKCCIHGNQTNPIPRKHLLKNGEFSV